MKSFVSLPLIAGLTLMGVLSPAWALYKVVGPDGKVTYTDRPPSQPAKTLRANGSTQETGRLPYELQQVADRYPVILYSTTDCVPCDAGRNLLRSRGIPYTEKSVTSAQDVEQFRQQESTETLPVVRIGGQRLVGYTESEWTSYLTAAGYPTKSVLPAGYQHPRAEPLVTPQTTVPVTPASNVDPRVAPAPLPAPVVPPRNTPGGIRF